MSRSTAFCFLVAVLIAAPSVGAQEIAWETDFEQAKARASEANKPLLITMHNSTEIACERMLTRVYSDPEVRKALADFVILPTCFDRHDEITDAAGNTVSKLFGGVSCDVLMKNEQTVREELLENNDVKVPQHLFLDAKGAIYLTKIYELKKNAFLDLLHRGLVMFGSKGVAQLDAELQKHYDAVKSGKEKDSEKAIKKLLELQDLAKAELLYYIIQGLGKDSDRAAAIRAFGSDEYSFASVVVKRWLSDRDPYIRNCAVVSLEEMKATDAGPELIAMFGRERKNEKELRKDLLRAFGPCCDGDGAARKILLEHVDDKDPIMRTAAYLSLGYFLDDEEVRRVYPERWKKEGKDITQKTAILWAYGQRRDSELVPVVEDLVKDERNGQLKLVAKMSVARLKGESAADVVGGKEFRKLLAPLYTRDKIVRNQVKRWRSWR